MRRDSHGGSEQVAQAQAGDGGGPVDGGLVWEVEPLKLGEGEIRRERGPVGKPGRPRGCGHLSRGGRLCKGQGWRQTWETGHTRGAGRVSVNTAGDGRRSSREREERVCSGRDSVELATRLTRGFPHRQGNSKSTSVCVSLDAHAHADTHTNTP